MAYDGVWISTIYPTIDLFHSVNLRSRSELFKCDIVTPSPEPVRSFCNRPLKGDEDISHATRYDLIILSHYWRDYNAINLQYSVMEDWLNEQYRGGAVIAAINSGIFWAASAGLLNGRSATTYWRHQAEFKTLFPAVNWLDNQALVEDAGIYSCNGHNAGMDLTIYLVGKFVGTELATELARDVTYDQRREYDLTLFNVAGLRQHRDNGILKAQSWLDKNYPGKVNMGQLADFVGMSKRTFIRRFQKATGNKPSRYLQYLRIEASKQKLINTDDSIKTISLNVGYHDYSYFSGLFKTMTALSPGEYRKRFRPY